LGRIEGKTATGKLILNLSVLFRKIAASEMAEAHAWYELQSPGLGVEFSSTISKYLDRISQNPDLYPLVTDDIRQAILNRFPFCIYYKIRNQKVIVLAIFHSARDPKNWQARN